MLLDERVVPNLEQPSRFWRVASHLSIVAVAALCKAFLYGLNTTEVYGRDGFLKLLKSRAKYQDRQRGLLTVSNHVSVLDDPLLWGTLPLSFTAQHLYQNHRFALGSHDIIFKNAFTSHFFTSGQTLPTHRQAHSPDAGGPFQATMTEAVGLFSRISTTMPKLSPFTVQAVQHLQSAARWPRDCVDPFSDLPSPPAYASSPKDVRLYHAPSRYASNSFSWIHVFPEGMIYQSPTFAMRYFKWGFTRLILEPAECPDVVPIFIEGTDQIMHESRAWPRFIPRIGKAVTVTFGEPVDTDAVFTDLRQRWRALEDAEKRGQQERQRQRQRQRQQKSAKYSAEVSVEGEQDSSENEVGLLGYIPADSPLAISPEAQALRIECAHRVRELVLAVRRSRSYPDDDPKSGYAATWAREGPKREGLKDDGTSVRDI
ncbi:hypothetical protein DV736_g6233, partial [Chaetothyriales sp. CBS 134916]